MDRAHAAQYIDCLKATGLRLYLLLYFAKFRLEGQRFVNGLRSGAMRRRPSACTCGRNYLLDFAGLEAEIEPLALVKAGSSPRHHVLPCDDEL